MSAVPTPGQAGGCSIVIAGAIVAVSCVVTVVVQLVMWLVP